MNLRFWLSLLLPLWMLGSLAGWGQPATAEQKCSENLQILLRSLAKYGKDHQGAYPDTLKELVPRYLSQLPQCPSGGSTYERYSVIAHNPERAVLICSYPGHKLNPPDYLVLSGDRGVESPFTRVSDPSICRHRLVQLAHQMDLERVQLGRFPESLRKEVACSCGDAMQYHALEEGKSYIAFCPGAAHLGSGLAPFSPSVTPAGLKEENFLIGRPDAQAQKPPSRVPLSWLLGALAVLLGVFLFSMRRGRIKLD